MELNRLFEEVLKETSRSERAEEAEYDEIFECVYDYVLKNTRKVCSVEDIQKYMKTNFTIGPKKRAIIIENITDHFEDDIEIVSIQKTV